TAPARERFASLRSPRFNSEHRRRPQLNRRASAEWPLGTELHSVDLTMNVVFCRRLRLQIDLSQRTLCEPTVPQGYHWVTWSPELLERHAAVKFRCFEREQDGRIFRSLRELGGCRQL